MKVTKAVILASGLNSRMFPISKIIPKAALPLGVKPAIHFLVEECINAGISEITIVCREGNKLIEKYFSRDAAFEKMLKKNNKKNFTSKFKKIENFCKFNFVYQKNQLGEAHALYSAKKFVKKQPFLVIYGDALYRSNISASKQALNKFQKKKVHIFGNAGRFVFFPSIFLLLSRINFFSFISKKGNGLSLPQIFENLIKEKDYIKFRILGKHFDIGNFKSYIEAFNAFSK